LQLAQLVRTGRKSTLKFLWSKTPQGINNARISQYRTISNYLRTRANNIAAYPAILKHKLIVAAERSRTEAYAWSRGWHGN